MRLKLVLISLCLALCFAPSRAAGEDLSSLKHDQAIADFRVANLYANGDAAVVGAKFFHTPTGAPVYVLQIETAPQSFVWIDAPADSNRGIAHSLEHLLANKGTRGRYLNLLRTMRLSQTGAATYQDYNFYCLTSGTGMAGFEEQFRALMDALFRPDFSDVEAEREFYHLGTRSDAKSRETSLIEQGTVYNEMQTGQGVYAYHYGMNQDVFGPTNPFSFNASGDPEEMRDVTPPEIRRFHSQYYRLGPGTGFIFVFPSRVNIVGFLAHLSEEFKNIPHADHPATIDLYKEPKYRISLSSHSDVRVFPFPSASMSDRGVVRLGWRPLRAASQEQVRLLQLFMKALADGEESVLYRSLIASDTREMDSAATGIESEVFLENSPWFPAEFITLRGISGNEINAAKLEDIRRHIVATIRTVSGYPDGSSQLLAFNKLVLACATAWKRDQQVWIKSSPLFSSEYRTDWKEHLNYLEMDGSFIRSLSDSSIWTAVESAIGSGRNVWRDIIEQFQLAENPYATGSSPSPQLLAALDQQRRDRLEGKARELKSKFGVSNQQDALRRYAAAELEKSRQIDAIEARVKRPRFAEHPPLTPDDDARFTQCRLAGVPSIWVFFEGAPTIDLGLSFDLRRIPQKYYKYLPILPRSFDSLGLNIPGGPLAFSDLLAQKARYLSSLEVGYSSNSVSGRADFTIRASAISQEDVAPALDLIYKMLRFSDLRVSNLSRLRDLVNDRAAEDEGFGKGAADSTWYWNLSDTFRHQDDPLYVALNSQLTQAHWIERLRWRIHEPVPVIEVDELGRFAEQVLASSTAPSRDGMEAKLSGLAVQGLHKELVQYWQKNIDAFPGEGLLQGLRALTAEVQEDLRAGPERTLREIREVQQLIISRGALKLDVTIDPMLQATVRRPLLSFLRLLPDRAPPGAAKMVMMMRGTLTSAPIIRRISARAHISNEFPWYVAFADRHSVTGALIFSADFPGYSQLRREDLITTLASKVASGTGPNTFYMKTVESGLAYSNSVRSDTRYRLLSYYAERVPDIPSLVELVNSFAASIPQLRDPLLLDYVLQKSFPFPRSMRTFTERGRLLAQDIYDGNEPATIRRFSRAILNLRQEPRLLGEILASGVSSISPVLLENQFSGTQHRQRTIFFFVGPERLLADAQDRLPLKRLIRVYSSDFWM